MEIIGKKIFSRFTFRSSSFNHFLKPKKKSRRRARNKKIFLSFEFLRKQLHLDDKLGPFVAFFLLLLFSSALVITFLYCAGKKKVFNSNLCKILHFYRSSGDWHLNFWLICMISMKSDIFFKTKICRITSLAPNWQINQWQK